MLDILVQANSRNFSLRLDQLTGKLKVKCRSAAIKEKANKEIIRELKKLFEAEIELIKGFHSKQKTLLIKGRKASEVESLLKELI